ncbi:MAG: hypothetical protein M1144_06540 [Candidatus Thermoplasmatota archaeon]|nr:hypothetical protein [Candidatus Thermoplasmatota archaeon]
MTDGIRTLSQETARRLAVTNQHLAGGPFREEKDHDILSVLRDIIYVQYDPFSTVAPSHILALWSRVEGFRTDRLALTLHERNP